MKGLPLDNQRNEAAELSNKLDNLIDEVKETINGKENQDEMLDIMRAQIVTEMLDL